MMENDFAKIKKLIEIHAQISELIERERELAIPRLTEPAYLLQISVWFCEFTNCSKGPVGLTTIRKMQFLFIVLLLYSPKSFIGYRTVSGIRGILTELLGYKSKSSISNYIVDLVQMYDNYKEFREEVNILYVKIMNRLDENRMLA